MYVHEIVDALGRSQSSISNHLRVLRNHNLVKQHREGQSSRYYLRASEITENVLNTLEHFQEALSRPQD
ncbi:MAG: ArsR/SmtB family transcription factor, partial [bacterium]